MNQTKFRYIKERVADLAQAEKEEIRAALVKKYKAPAKPAAVLKYELKVTELSNALYKETREANTAIDAKWKALLDKAYLSDDKEILELLTK